MTARLFLAPFAALMLFLPVVIHPFGKNKVVYHSHDWSVLETAHFRIYLTAETAPQSNRIADLSENIFDRYAVLLEFTPRDKIRLMIYPNPVDFQQNNIVDWIGPGTGGFTEFVKGRVVLPYSAHATDFEHVLSHEIHHAFQGHIWGRGVFSVYTVRDIAIPLWMIEGMTEYNSIGVDPEAEMVVADGVLNGVLPSLMKLSYLGLLAREDYFYVYKQGQLFYDWITREYGQDVMARLNRSIAELREMDAVLTNVFGKTLPELNAGFFDHLRKRYMPGISNLVSVELAAEKILKEDSAFNMNPVSLGSNRVAFVSDRRIYPSVLIYDRDRDSLDTAVKGGFDEEFLEFQYGRRNHLSVSTNGLLCFVSRSGDRDAIHLYDLKKRRARRVDLPFRVIHSPDISPDGRRIVFAATENGRMDIFLHDRENGKTLKITDDEFYNTQPRFFGSNRIVLASNRRTGSGSAEMDLLVYDLERGEFTLLLDTGASEEYPAVSPDGKLLAFIRQDVHPSLMIYDPARNILYRELVPTGGVFAPNFTEKGTVLLSAYHRRTYNIYEYKPEYRDRWTNFTVTARFSAAAPAAAAVPAPARTNTVTPYFPEFSLDSFFGGFMLNTSLGMAALGMLRFSDMMGDHRFQLLMDTAILLTGNFLEYLNADLSYFNFRYRHNFGFRVFHYSNYFYEFSTFQEFYSMERAYHTTYGGFALYAFPFTTFDRIQAEVGYRGFSYASNVVWTGSNYTYDLSYRSRSVVSAAYVHDSTLNDVTGPVDGIRYEFLAVKSFPLLSDSLDYQKFVMDFRSYFLITPGYSVALRGVAGYQFGPDQAETPFYVGGFNSVRGHDLWGSRGDAMFLFNFELRVPFIRDWTLGFPFPIRLPTVWGALFWDFGSAWQTDRPYVFGEPGPDEIWRFRDFKSGFGFGFRLVLLPGIKFMVDLAAPFDGAVFPDTSRWKSFWFIGIDF